jgi:serpin B
MFLKNVFWVATLSWLTAIGFTWGCTKDSHNGKTQTPPRPAPDSQSAAETRPPPENAPRTAPSRPTRTTTQPRPVRPGDLGARKAETVKKLAAGQNVFAVDLYKKISQEKGNLFLSPFSVSTALSMTYAGAHGKTAAQMHKVLHLGLKPTRVHAAFNGLLQSTQPPQDKNKSPYQLNVANKIFVQKGRPVLPSFKQMLRTYYGSAAENVNFGNRSAAAGKINGWVAKQTKNKIKKIVAPSDLGALTRLVLTNAIYFKGTWRYLFKEKRTRPRKFFLTPKNKVKVETMYQKSKFRYGTAPGLQILEMDYQGGDLSMVLVLPRKKDGLSTLEKKLGAKEIESWLAALRKRKVHVYLPKFKLKWGRSIKSDLIALGMTAPFSRAVADFRGINGHSDAKGLYISNVLHKAFVEVNEEGTEAAGATAVVMKVKGIAPPAKRTPVFRADHPFMFMIRHKKTGSILFIGRLADPR